MATTKIIYFLRHGESQANAATNEGRDIRDPELTKRGCLQAAAWAFETPAWGVDRVFVSPLLRTLQTGLLAFSPETPLHVRRSLREHGWHEDQNKGSPVDELKSRLTSLDLNINRIRGMSKLANPHKFWDPSNEAGLTSQELHNRRKAATRFLERDILQQPEQVLALVSHYNTIKHFVGKKLHNCEAVRVDFQFERRGWVVRSAAQLDMPELPSMVQQASFSLSAISPEEVGSKIFDSDDEASVLAAEQSSGCEEEEDGAGPINSVAALGTAVIPAAVRSIYETKQFKNASVLVLGKSIQYNNAVALLGGGKGRMGYRYSDFGGGLDGGPARFGGRPHKVAERRWPHLGAFRELAEEMLGLHGDEARACACRIWQASCDRLIGGEPIQHGSHLIFLVPAEAICDGIGMRSSALPAAHQEARQSLEGIDALGKQFVPNSEVSDVNMFIIDDLLACTEPKIEKARLLEPIWSSNRKGGRPRFYPKDDQIRIETAFQALNDNEMYVLHNTALVRSVSKTHVSVRRRRGEVRLMDRLDSACIRKALVGPTGSLNSCAAVLRAFAIGASRHELSLLA